ncbi:MAG: hypothetical protein JO040_11490 [Gemmatimonadetes bacterium]|nr:hypothetical protein [Gemmatimonadota bacterium]
MMKQPSKITLSVGTAVLVASCGRGQVGGPHDMGSMRGHDAGAMKAHARAEVAFLFPDGDDRGWSKLRNGVDHKMAPDVPLASLPAGTRARLIHQLALTAEVMKKYPTVWDAEAAGYRRFGSFKAGLGTHYIGGHPITHDTLTDDDVLHPAGIDYDGSSPDSPIVGFMYTYAPPGGTGPGSREPEGFAGPNDHWHHHRNICLTPGSNGAMEGRADGRLTEAQCRASGGGFTAAGPYAVHVWTVPAFTNPLGVFAHSNPAVTCADGTYHMEGRTAGNPCHR